MKRVIVEPPVIPLESARDLLAGVDVVVDAPPRPWTGEDVVGLLVWQAVSEADMARLPNLRAIVTGSIGYDHIDLEAAKRRGIWVCNVPDYCIDEVADTTIALLLALVRGLVVLDRSVRDGRWDDHAGGVLPRISDTRLGIVGFGRIGRAVARRAKGLGIETRASDPVVPREEIAAAGVMPATFDDLLGQSTAVTVHIPLTNATRNLIGARELALMPRGSYLINTARGGLVDTQAVIAALDSGQLAGAALDVLPVEPPTPSAPVPKHPKFIVTPHAAWYSLAAEYEVVRQVTRSLRALMDGQMPDGIVVTGASMPATHG